MKEARRKQQVWRSFIK